MLREGIVESEEGLIAFNRRIVELGERTGKPVVAACDSHFLDPEDEVYRRLILAGEKNAEADHQPPLFYRTTGEMLAEFAYLGAEKAYEVVVTNTRAIAARVEPLRPIPEERYSPAIKGAEEELTAAVNARALEVYGDPLPRTVRERVERELETIVKNKYAVMYVAAREIVGGSERAGYMVGSRGSVGSSLVATLAGITEVNPLPAHYYCAECHYYDDASETVRRHAGGSGCDLPRMDCPQCGAPLKRDGHDITFETFFGFNGEKAPDVDLNFSGEYQSQAHAHVERLFGAGQVYKAGTITTIADKTAYGYVMKYCEKRGVEIDKAEVNSLAAGLTGIKRTTGQHPGGLVIVPEGHNIEEFCPVQYPANKDETGVVTTHFDYDAISGCLLKLDILGHDVPTIMRLLHDFTGVDPRGVPLDDKRALSLFVSAEAILPDGAAKPGSLGLPEFGTPFVRQMLSETRPSSFSELVRISGLSHGTNVWTHNAQELIRSRTATLREIIPSRDDIMVYLINKGVEKGAAFRIMESVRGGRGVPDEDAERMRGAGVPEWYIESCRKIKYLFPKAHAVAYVLMTVRIAYYKLYHPQAFYAAAFTVRAGEFDYVRMCMGGPRAVEAYEKLNASMQRQKAENPEAKESARDKATLALLELIIEMYRRGIGFAPLDVYVSEATRFVPSPNGIIPPLCAVQGLGEAVAAAIVREREEKPFETISDFKKRTKANKNMILSLRRFHALDAIRETNQISLFETG
jgi:DNA polymerase-3 subunit alpha (Gram-positive type)